MWFTDIPQGVAVTIDGQERRIRRWWPGPAHELPDIPIGNAVFRLGRSPKGGIRVFFVRGECTFLHPDGKLFHLSERVDESRVDG